MNLNPNADCTNTAELAEYLLKRIKELVAEYDSLENGSSFKDYVNGLLSGFSTVLITIGYPSEHIPYEDN